eukprot:754873-Hanusia_phi.AAC.2
MSQKPADFKRMLQGPLAEFSELGGDADAQVTGLQESTISLDESKLLEEGESEGLISKAKPTASSSLSCQVMLGRSPATCEPDQAPKTRGEERELFVESSLEQEIGSGTLDFAPVLGDCLCSELVPGPQEVTPPPTIHMKATPGKSADVKMFGDRMFEDFENCRKLNVLLQEINTNLEERVEKLETQLRLREHEVGWVGWIGFSRLTGMSGCLAASIRNEHGSIAGNRGTIHQIPWGGNDVVCVWTQKHEVEMPQQTEQQHSKPVVLNSQLEVVLFIAHQGCLRNGSNLLCLQQLQSKQVFKLCIGSCPQFCSEC